MHDNELMDILGETKYKHLLKKYTFGLTWNGLLLDLCKDVIFVKKPEECKILIYTSPTFNALSEDVSMDFVLSLLRA